MSNLNYVDYNFDTLVQQLTNRVAASATWKDTYRSGTGQMVLELYAYVANLVMYYIERTAEEGFIDTAKNRSSIINLVRLLGYTPKRATSARGEGESGVTFSLVTPRAYDITIPKYTVLTTASGTAFIVNKEVTMTKGLTSLPEVSVIQGKVYNAVITSTGTSNQEYNLNFTDIENSADPDNPTFTVTVDNVPWTKVSTFVGGSPSAQWYKLRGELNDTLTVIFGDNISAQAPAAGSVITIKYLRTDGASGNVYVLGAINTIQTPIYDKANIIVDDISVSNPQAVLGGDDIESTEEIRTEAPRVFATGDRLVTKADYAAFLENYPAIASATTWGENEESPANYDMFNRVKMCIIMQADPDTDPRIQDWDTPSPGFKDQVIAAIQTKSMLTVKYTFIDPVILQVILDVDLKVLPGYQLGNVESLAQTALSNLFMLGTTTMLGVSKRYADLIKAVEDVPGVSYHHLTMSLYKDMVKDADPSTTYRTILEKVPLKAGEVRVLVSLNGGVYNQVAVDNRAGVFTSTGAYTVTGTVDYVNGTVVASMSPALTAQDRVAIKYQSDTSGDIVVDLNEICKLTSINITASSYDE